MATIWPLLLLFSTISIAEAQQPEQSFFRAGSFLTPTGTNSSWLSRSGLYAFGFYKQGNGYAVGIFVAGIRQKTLVWTANRDNPPVPGDVKLHFTSNGRLVLQTAQGMETGIAGNTEGAAAASMLDSGNFVLYNSDNSKIWQSFDKPTDTFLPGQKLTTDEVMFSSYSAANQSTGIFRLIMQQDGWLAMYPVGTPFTIEYGYWGAGVSGEGTDVTLNFDADGRLYLLNGTGISIVNITTGNPTKGVIYRLTLDPDGILRQYSHNMDQNGVWNVTWSGPKDVCDPKGLCGINAFCDQDAGCECLPGFKRVNQDSWASGCERNFDSKSCKSNEAVTGYTMEAELHTEWHNDSYSILTSSTQDACGEACLGDCNCEAALYKDGECRKQRLPLKFGRRTQGESSVALIKVGTSPISPDPRVPKESKKKNRVDILIIGVSLLSFACIILVISGILFYKYRVWLYRNISNAP
ncbi:G-type lectin S-receptor-like serine/threonine-protein kinase LECRK1 [Juglans microcarpa x Juglans regia]|uniref:G-type lectin S-receptor-like serine/threonine-protein kinase LECRK1 n=1 Tax=Juglans microcarpa x Juglans regia TaxID=2249226 RepID=UPI001B7E1209|nr:G-type lectin S-receptor-like serine/threonine-protein kinase LECRK1 [Juglans microcarpa x Juglans regia]XP_041005734.1 G-type lectin S-receptor-like serine/threonine-protein kinase LECRK1 [Juglans microcarpa x Juglans regia]